MTKNIVILLVSFLQIGLFSIGGGYATIPLIQEQVVDLHHWLTLKEFTDIITISQMTPGPLAVNASTFVGMRIAGIFGAIVATLGCIISGFILSIILYKFFKKHKDIDIISSILKGLRSISVGLIISSTFTILLITFCGSQWPDAKMLNFNITAIFVFIISLFLLRKYKTNPISIIILTGIVGLFLYQ
ncbi:chromate transporter [Tissierella sp. P1]|jgi:chromate transporter|uniref:chromate transporter n=1 Tax=Tissierella sp. P1 TaxID=1280483 RepID=UPI000BA04147|nr:chromate transporter [Tissierella sp. P1]MDU5082787.1 chromate transporter [Bacillota bacterium]OZV11034.1 chromate transporter [Tissierella sp. P1]